MKFALLIHSDQDAWADTRTTEKARLRAETMPRWTALFEELGKAGPTSRARSWTRSVEGEEYAY